MSILLVDDDSSTTKVLGTILNENEYETTVAHSVNAAIRRLQADSSTSLIILDVVMPGGEGYEFLKFINSNLRFRHIPVIMCSGYADGETIKRAIACGAKDFIAKPVKADVLLKKVKGALERAKKTILLVGQDPQLLDILERIIKRDGFNTLKANSGQAALDVLDSDSYVDLIISAIEMPEMSGWDLLIEAKEKNFRLPVLLILDNNKPTDADPLAAGADGTVSMPFENISIGRTLKEVFSKVDKPATIGG